MAVLDQIQQMKNQGMPDEEIVRNLQDQGISPKQINDALNQSQIKRAVVDERDMDPANQRAPPYPNQQAQGNYVPQTQEVPESPTPSEQTYQQQEYSQPQEGYQGYPEEEYAYPSGGMDSDTIIEIAEQVFSEKMKKTQKQVDNLSEFKTLAQTRIENITDRLKRIETIIDKLQISILEKIGSYGDNIDNIKKEMSMMQDSFGKVVNQAVKGKSTSKKTSGKKISRK